MSKELVKKSNLPSFAFRVFGCQNCDWRSSHDCPFFDGGSTVLPKEGICEKKKRWVIGLVPTYDSVPSVARFMLDASKRLGHERSFREASKLDELDKLIVEANEKGKFKTAARLRKEYDAVYNRWVAVWDKVSKLEDSQVSRETVKKVELRSVSFSDVAKFMEEANKEDEVRDV